MRDLNAENYKTLIKETENFQVNRKLSHALGLGELIVKMTILPKTIYRLNVISIKLLMTFFTNNPKIDMEKIQNCHSNPEVKV